MPTKPILTRPYAWLLGIQYHDGVYREVVRLAPTEKAAIRAGHRCAKVHAVMVRLHLSKCAYRRFRGAHRNVRL